MLKNLLVFTFVVALMIPATAQHQRRVLIEEFTNASSLLCAQQNPAFNQVIADKHDYLTPIKYQTYFPGYDPINAQNPDEVVIRMSYYGVTSVPNGRQNGTLEVFPMNSYSPAIIDAGYYNLTPVTMTMTHSISPNHDSIYLHVDVTSDLTLTGNLRLRVAATEEEILFNFPPGGILEKEFYHVMRKMLPDATGTLTGDFAAGETKIYDFAWKIGYAYDLNKMSGAAWLQNDATKEVLQSAHSLPVGGIPYLGVQVPTIYKINCVFGASPSFTMTNTASANLTTALLNYRINGGAWIDYPWTGDLAPGATEVVTLTGTTMTATGVTKVEVRVASSNNGFVTNLIDNISTVKTKSLLDAPAAIPFSNGFQASSIPADWTVFNPTSDHGWQGFPSAGSNSTRSALCDFYNIAEGDSALLVSPKINLVGASGPTALAFDYAYTYYDDTLFDSLRVEVSANCGETWTTLFHDGYNGLVTAAPRTTSYIPANSDWVTRTFDLTSYNGAEILIRFLAESGYGNNLYIDNINVAQTTGVKELTLNTFDLTPNPTRNVANVRFSLAKPESVRLLVFNSIGALVQTQDLGELSTGEFNQKLDATNLNSGSYRVVLQGKEGVAQTQWVIVK